MKKQFLIPLTIIFLFYFECASVGNNTDTPPAVENKERIERMRILVYPFENTGEEKFSWISSGMTDTVISDLSSYHEISVIADEDRRKAFKEIASGQKGILKEATISQAGKMTGANLILRGSYLVQGDAIRVNARIVQVDTGTASKPVKLDGTVKEIFDLQDKIVATLLEDSENITNLKIDKDVVGKTNLQDRPNIEAFELYSKGKGNSRY
jgi:TolB-like protein